jgi:hypothetical protein
MSFVWRHRVTVAPLHMAVRQISLSFFNHHASP